MKRTLPASLSILASLLFVFVPSLLPAQQSSDNSALRQQLDETNKLLREQADAIRLLRQQLEAQQHQIDALRPATAPALSGSDAAQLQSAVGDLKKAPATSAAVAISPAKPGASAAKSTADAAPADLFFRIGHATFTPNGWIDFTTIFRSTNVGSGTGTNFQGIPYANTAAGGLSEVRMTAQSSRIGFKVEEKLANLKAYGYLEADFNGTLAGNAYVSTNSNTPRMRVYYMDLSGPKWEILGGQSWSLITPTRKALSPFLADLFNTYHLDTNYQAGLPYARQTQIRFIYHPTKSVSFGLSAENSEQFVGSAVTLPTNFTATEVDANSSNSSAGGGTTTPNMMPDIVSKLTWDHTVNGHYWHIGVGGLMTSAHISTPASVTKADRVNDSRIGGAGEFNLNLELFKGFRLISLGYWSDGAGRYIGGMAPNFVVLQNGDAKSPFSIAQLHSGSGIGGFEWNIPGKTLLSAYYSGVYVQRRYGLDPGATTTPTYIGYGFDKSSNTNNRRIQEISLATQTTLWKSANHGSFQYITQSSWVERAPWYVNPKNPKDAHTFMEYMSLRYIIP